MPLPGLSTSRFQASLDICYSAIISTDSLVISIGLFYIYIFMLWFVSFFFLLFFPRLISAAADWMSAILAHMVWP